MGLLERLHERGHTILLVTHEHDIAAHARRIVSIRDGRIASDEPVPAPALVLAPSTPASPPAAPAAPAAGAPAAGAPRP
jgi:energy-coupling factor transporter ATP-binding protein EcfA2